MVRNLLGQQTEVSSTRLSSCWLVAIASVSQVEADGFSPRKQIFALMVGLYRFIFKILKISGIDMVSNICLTSCFKLKFLYFV